MGRKPGAEHYGAERFESVEAKAQRTVREELKQRKWKEADLKARRKGDREKIWIAQRLRAETRMSLTCISRRLEMGTRMHLAHLLCRHKTL